MAISVDWPQRVINVPRADMLLLQTTPIEIRQLDIDTFRLALRNLEDGADGMLFPDTHNHIAPVSVGGVTLARVMEIINGYTITFEDGSYAVNISGGNSNIGDVVNLNSVSVRSANSAGLAYFEEIQQQSYHGGVVYIDIAEGTPGRRYPAGTPQIPVNNLTDALAIGAAYGYDEFLLRGAMAIDNAVDIGRTRWNGTDRVHSILTFDGTQTADHTIFHELGLSGDLGEHCVLYDCDCNNLSGVGGSVYRSIIRGTLTAHPAATLMLADCRCGESGNTPAILDHNGSAANVNARGWIGNLKIVNLTTAKSISIDMLAGNLEIDASCTAGTVYVRGSGNITDNSGVGCTVDLSGMAADATTIASAVWDAQVVDYVTDGTLGADLAAAIAKIADVYDIQGLNPARPVTVTSTTRISGPIVQAIAGTSTQKTMTRQ